MREDDTTEQLYAMREQLQLLEKERLERQREVPARAVSAAEETGTPAGETLPPELASWLGEEGEIDAQAILADLREGANRWLGEFNEDLKDTKPSTLLLVFGLGVMVGKMTA
jgi:hypothetical protein